MAEQKLDREAVVKLLEGRSNPSAESLAFGTERIDIELHGAGNGPFRCAKRDWAWVVDEPPERGGTDSAPNPLAYFLSGSASCLLSHYMLCAIAGDVPIEALKLRARMRFHRLLKGGRITEVIYDITISSPAGAEAVTTLAEQAQGACYAHNTLGAAGVKLTTHLEVNGEKAATLHV